MFLDVITISFKVWLDVVLFKHPAPCSNDYPVFTLDHPAPRYVIPIKILYKLFKAGWKILWDKTAI